MTISSKNKSVLFIALALTLIQSPNAHAESWLNSWIFNPLKKHSVTIAAAVGATALAAIGYYWYKKSDSTTPSKNHKKSPAKKSNAKHHSGSTSPKQASRPVEGPLRPTINDLQKPRINALQEKTIAIKNSINAYLTDANMFNFACENPQAFRDQIYIFRQRIEETLEQVGQLSELHLEDTLTAQLTQIENTLKNALTMLEKLISQQREHNQRAAQRRLLAEAVQNDADRQLENQREQNKQQHNIAINPDRHVPITHTVNQQPNNQPNKEREEKKQSEKSESQEIKQQKIVIVTPPVVQKKKTTWHKTKHTWGRLPTSVYQTLQGKKHA